MSRFDFTEEFEFVTEKKHTFHAEVEVDQNGDWQLIGLKTDANIVDYIEDSYDFFMIQLRPLVEERLNNRGQSRAEALADDR